jgi:E3 ubiquitin-protein ligase listerin
MLFLHPSRRIRLLSAILHSSFLRLSSLREEFLRNAVSDDRVESVIGSWCMLVHDVDGLVASSVRRAWNEFVSIDPSTTDKIILDDRLMSLLLAFIQRTVLDPGGTYSDLNPVPPAVEPKNETGKRQPASTQPKKDVGGTISRLNTEDEFETEQERNARLRIGAMGAVRWILSRLLVLQRVIRYEHFSI